MESWSKYAKLYDPIKCASIDGTDCDPHDRAVVRALNATYKPNRFVKGRPECTIFVSRLNHETTKDTIKEIFSKYGKLKRFRIIKDIVTGMSKGYAFVEYEEEQSAEEAYRLANKMLVDERHIFVDFECERLLKGWKPRRLGGGFGGKKESGQLRFGGRDRPFKKPIALEMKEKKEKRAREEEERRRRVRHKRNSSPKRKSLSKERKRPKSPPPKERSRSKQSSETKPLRKKSPANSNAQSRKSKTNDRHHSPHRENNGRPPSPPQRNRKRYSPYKGENQRRPPSPRIDKPIREKPRRESPLGRRSPISNHENNYREQSPKDQNQSRTLYNNNTPTYEPSRREPPLGRRSPILNHENNYRVQPARNNYREQFPRDQNQSRTLYNNNNNSDVYESSRREFPVGRRSPILNHENNYRGQPARNDHENNYREQSPIRDQIQSRTLYNNDNSVYLPPNVDFHRPPPAFVGPSREYSNAPRMEFAARDLRQEDYRPRDQYFPPEESNYPPFRRNFAPAPVRGRGRGGGARGGHIPYQMGGIRGGFQRY